MLLEHQANTQRKKLNMNVERKKVLVLFSGGIDSTACIHYYKRLGYKIEGLFINYNQKSLKSEEVAVKLLSEYFKIKTKIVKLDMNQIAIDGEIQGRNFMFLSIAFMNFTSTNGLISLGIHSGTTYPDCSKEFILKSQEILNLYTSGNVFIDCPFIELNKREVYEYFKSHDLPIEYTYSCENGVEVQPCGNCSSCKDLIKLYEI
ncbi:7-cyano-7-deazaguanine synthase [Labilibaculum euxinus]